jgi:hypothetical protein
LNPSIGKAEVKRKRKPKRRKKKENINHMKKENVLLSPTHNQNLDSGTILWHALRDK